MATGTLNTGKISDFCNCEKAGNDINIPEQLVGGLYRLHRLSAF